MPLWLLDTGPVDLLAQNLDLERAWPSDCLHVVREVASEAESNDASGKRRRLLQSTVRVHDIPVPSDCAMYLYGTLRPTSSATNKNLGEAASVAFAAVLAPDAVFVTEDKLAAFLALCELGPGRVATTLDLLADLRDRAMISQAEWDRAATWAWKRMNLTALPARF